MVPENANEKEITRIFSIEIIVEKNNKKKSYS